MRNVVCAPLGETAVQIVHDWIAMAIADEKHRIAAETSLPEIWLPNRV